MLHCTMKHRDALDETICSILTEFRRIAVVGMSEKPWRDSHRVGLYLHQNGYDVIPVNPAVENIAGLTAYPGLKSGPGPLQIVNVFRRLEFIPEVVEQAIQCGAKALWTQLGLVENKSARRARDAGMRVVMDRCIMVEHSLHLG